MKTLLLVTLGGRRAAGNLIVEHILLMVVHLEELCVESREPGVEAVLKFLLADGTAVAGRSQGIPCEPQACLLCLRCKLQEAGEAAPPSVFLFTCWKCAQMQDRELVTQVGQVYRIPGGVGAEIWRCS